MTTFGRRARVLVGTTYRSDPRRFVLNLICASTLRVLPMLAAVFVKLVLDGIVDGTERNATVWAALAGACVALTFVVQRLVSRESYTLIETSTREFDREIIRLSAEMPRIGHLEDPQYLDKLEQLRYQPRSLGMSGVSIALAAVLTITQAVFLVVVLTSIDPILLVLPIAAGINVWATRVGRTQQNAAFEATAADRRRANHFLELGTSAARADEVRTLRVGPELVRREQKAWAAADSPMRRAETRGAMRSALAGLAFAIAYVGAITLVVERAVRGDASPGDVVLTVLIAGIVNQNLQNLVDTYSLTAWGLLLVDKLVWLQDRAAAERRPAGLLQSPPRFDRGIAFEDVTFAYPGSSGTVLRDLNLELPAGTVVALVGDNGVGKTTFVKLLTGMYAPTAGRVLVDGVPLEGLDLESWRASCATAFQDYARLEFLLSESVGAGDLPRVDDADAVTVAFGRAGAEELPGRLDAGLATPLGASMDGGTQLSGGQWQKVALSRAMMRDSPLLLVFDEPTASLDPDAERALFERWSHHARVAAAELGTFTVLVSHRFSTVRMADLIVVLDATGLREVGTHQELIQRAGLYAELYELQAAGYR